MGASAHVHTNAPRTVWSYWINIKTQTYRVGHDQMLQSVIIYTIIMYGRLAPLSNLQLQLQLSQAGGVAYPMKMAVWDSTRTQWWSREPRVVPSLQSLAQSNIFDSIVSTLGVLDRDIRGIFSCGGYLDAPDQIELVYRKKNGEWSSQSVIFPGPNLECLKDLIEAGSPATFGRGEENVYDKNYRDAVSLEPSMFMTNFQPASSSILQKIHSLLLQPFDPLYDIQVEPHKLNIYTTGGHFKAHVDTPRSLSMIGSLVICLPSFFRGGQLITKHGGKKISFDWSATSDYPPCKLKWAAFYSDVEHEILPVTEGHRVTMTFNLYGVGLHVWNCDRLKLVPATSKDPIVDYTSLPFYHELRSIIRNPAFMREGGVLGFPCQHCYFAVKEKLNHEENLTVLLKGSDNVVYSVAKLLSLNVSVKPVNREMNVVLSNFLPSKELLRRKDSPLEDDESSIEVIPDNYKVKFTEAIAWVTGSGKPDLAFVFMRYHRDIIEEERRDALDYIYQEPAILITVPKWCKERRTCGEVSKSDSNDSIAGSPSAKKQFY